MMTVGLGSSQTLSATDTLSLKTKLARSTRHRRIKAFLLVFPALIFLLISFIYPIGLMLFRSVHSPDFSNVMHRTAAELQSWDGVGLPGERVWAALAADLREARTQQTVGRAASVVNFEMPAARSLFTKTARRADALAAPYKDAIIAVDANWNNHELWALMKRLSDPITARFYLRAVDSRVDQSGAIAAVPAEERIYLQLFIRTFVIAGIVMVACLLLGYPVAYMLSTLPIRYANMLMILVLLPFWTSLLVRTTAWIVLLQNQGVVNSILVWAGLLQDSGRVQLIFNTTGTVIAMTHILLPYMILPLYGAMRAIPPSYMRAARSLGADQVTAFMRVFLPLTYPAVGAGCLIVYILAIGYYITPALVGGETGTLISNMIAYHMQQSLNWGLAAALASLLLVGMLALYFVYKRIAGAAEIRLG